MSTTILLLIGIAAIVGLLLLILWLKLHPFLALILVSSVVALAAGIPAKDLNSTIEQGLGKTLGHVAIIIALGAMIGRMIEVSGGADAFARELLSRFGEKRAPVALTIAGFFIGIPVFFEVAVIMLMPLCVSISRTTGRSLIVFALPMCAAMLIVHALLPPHPGAVAVAGLLGGSLGLILLYGLPVTAVTSVFAFLIAKWLTKRSFPLSEGASEPTEPPVTQSVHGTPLAPPGAGTVLALILLLIATWLAVYKPFGVTPYARRINRQGSGDSSAAAVPASTIPANPATGTPIWVYVIGFAVLVVMFVVVLRHLSGTSFGH